MRIAIVDPSLFTLPYDRELCRALAELGHEVYFFSRRLRAEEGFWNRGIQHRAVFYRLSERLRGLPRTAYLLAKGVEHLLTMSRVETFMKAVEPDLVHFQWLPLPTLDQYMIRRLGRRLPLVLTVHDSVPYNGCPSSKVQNGSYRSLLNGFQRLIVHTDQAVDRLSSMGIAAEKIVTIPHGPLNVGSEWQIPNTGANSSARESGQTQREDEPVVFLVLGKIKPYKGIDTLIKAVAQVPESIRQKCRFLVAGEPCMDVTPLKEMCAECGLESYFNFECRYLTDDEFQSFLKSASVMVFPYREIDASGVLMVCLAHGIPIIATELGLFKQLLTDREHGRLIPANDSTSLATALIELACDADLRRRAGAEVLKLSASVPKWTQIAELTTTVYNRAVEEHDQRTRSAILRFTSQKSKALS